jgi:hypothetical protein
MPGASPDIKRKALAIKEAAKLAVYDARNGTPFRQDF